MSRLVTAFRAVVPDFARRPLTWEDFEATCAQERLAVDVRPWRYDEQLFRRQRRIVLDAKLAPTYRLFAAWHAMGHWVLHPGDEAHYLERGWLNPIERQASLVGLLALIPWTKGPPYPILEKAMAEDDRLTFELLVPAAVEPRARWVKFRTTLMRYRPPE